jgi:hypothetical protein
MMTFSVSPMSWDVTYKDGEDPVLVARVSKINERVWIEFQDEALVFEAEEEFTNLTDCLSVLVKAAFKIKEN